MPASKYTLNKLLQGKMFLGGVRNKWNPEIVSYLSGARHHIYILDIIASSLRLKKFLSFTELCAIRRGRPIFILTPSFEPLRHVIHPNAYYVPEYKGGVVSNFKALFRFYNSGYFVKIVRKLPMFPFGIIAFNDYTRRVSYIANESACTRTPCALFADSSHSPFNVSYSIFSSSDYNVAHLMVSSVLAAIRRGKRREKKSLRRYLRTLVKKTVKKRSLRVIRSLPLLLKFRQSSLFLEDIRQRRVFKQYYSRNRLLRLFPKYYLNEKYKSWYRQLKKPNLLSTFKLLKRVAAFRKLLSCISLLKNVSTYRAIKKLLFYRRRHKFFHKRSLRRIKYKRAWRKFNMRWKYYRRFKRIKKKSRIKPYIRKVSRHLFGITKSYLTAGNLLISSKKIRSSRLRKYRQTLTAVPRQKKRRKFNFSISNKLFGRSKRKEHKKRYNPYAKFKSINKQTGYKKNHLFKQIKNNQELVRKVAINSFKVQQSTNQPTTEAQTNTKRSLKKNKPYYNQI